MTWFESDDLGSVSSEEAVMEAVTLSPTALKSIAKKMGLNVTSDDEGHYMTVPNDISTNRDFNNQFIDYWVGASAEKQSIEQKRKIRNSAYESMDSILGEAVLTLDAYADEALGVGFIEQPIDIEISDEAIRKDVMEILERNKIITRSRGHLRNLCKWGDLGAKIELPKSNDPLDINIKMMTPDEWEAFFMKKGPTPLGYHLSPNYGSRNFRVKKEDLLQPWEFVQFTVPDDEYAPYGRSLLEAMRTSFDQLVTIEALLALSRASRVERLVIKVPTGQTNPTAALAKLNHIKSVWKNVVFSDKKGKSSQARTPSLMDVMFMPSDENFSIERLPSGSGVEISSTEDVQYFRDQVLMMSGLPKGYLLADESTDRYHSLAAQDLKFARKLIPYQDAYAAGLTQLCMVLAGYVGADNLENLKITVKIKRPVQTSDPLLQNYEAISRAAVEMIDNFKRAASVIDGEGNEIPPTIDPTTYSLLMAELGMPDDIIKLLDNSVVNDPKPPENSPDDDGISNSSVTILNDKKRRKGLLDKYLKERSSKYVAKCTSFQIYKENKELFGLLFSSPEGKVTTNNVLKEALDGSIKPVITSRTRSRSITEEKGS